MLANGSSYRHIKEILLHLAPYAGYPLVLETLIRLKEIGANLQLTIADEAPPKPEEVEPGDAQPYQKLLKLDENFGKFVMSETRQVWARGHLTARERVYISLAVDVFYQTLTEPFRFHLEQARQCGISLAEIKAVIRFLGEFSIGRAWEALCALVPANPAAAWS